MRTKQEVISFLEGKVGTKVPCPGRPDLSGQCVTLIKSLMEFLGVPNPYKARGHAKTAISAYLNEGIADKGVGFLSVFSNANMGGGYGHIWCNAGEGDGVFYESNGAKPLIVTKGKTYAYDTVCNFDKWIQKGTMANMYRGYDLANPDSMKVAVDVLVRLQTGELVATSERDDALNKFAAAHSEIDHLDEVLKTRDAEIAELKKQLAAKPTILPTDSTWIVNGKTVTTTEGNVTTTINYAVKQ